VHVANNGREALDALQLRRYDVVLMDLQMPVMGGIEACTLIRASESGDEHIPIIAMTAHAMARDRDMCFAAGMDGFVSKPVRIEQLMSEIERVLRADSPPPLLIQRKEESIMTSTTGFNSAETLERLGGDRELFAQVAQIYVESTAAQLEVIAAALTQGELEQVYREAHSLKGSTSTFEAPSALASVAEVEACAKRRDLAAANNAFPLAQELVTQLLAELAPFADEGAQVGQ
jgi:CheY-like chemotaxis protein/HPt (histidine-containing phosphotransfer) domain-containing protein